MSTNAELVQELRDDVVNTLTSLAKSLHSMGDDDDLASAGARSQLSSTVDMALKLLSAMVERSGEFIPLWRTDPACLAPTRPEIGWLARAIESGQDVDKRLVLRGDYLLVAWTRDVLNSLQSGLSTTSAFDASRLQLASLRSALDALSARHTNQWTSAVTSESEIIESTWRALIDTSRYLVRSDAANALWPLVRAVQITLGAVLGESGDVVLIRIFSAEQLAQLTNLLGQISQSSPENTRPAMDQLDEWLDGALDFARNYVRRMPEREEGEAALRSNLSELETRVQSLRAQAKQLLATAAVTKSERSAERALRAEQVARKVATDAGTNQLAEWFDEFATSRKHGSWLWFSAATAIIAATVVTLVRHHDGDPTWQQALASAAYSLPLFALATFAARESSRARTAQLWAASLTVQLRTLEAYSEILDSPAQTELYVRFSEHVFIPLAATGQPTELKTIPAEVLQLIEVLAANAKRT